MSTTFIQAGLSAPPSPDPYDAAVALVEAAAASGYRAVAFCDPSKRPTDDKIREILKWLDFTPAYVDTNHADAPGELTVDGIAVRGQTWVARGNFYFVRRPE